MEVESKSSYRFIIGALTIGIQVCQGLIWVAPGPLFPVIMREFGISRATVSWTTSIVSLIMAMFAIIAGIAASKVGSKIIVTLGVFLAATGVLTLFSSNISQLLATRIVFALGTAMTFPVIGGLVMQWFRGNEIPLFNGFNLSAASIGNAIALFATVPLANIYGWKTSLALYAMVAFVLALVWLILGKENKAYAANPRPQSSLPATSIGEALKHKTTFLLGITMGGPNMLFMGISSWLPAYYNEVFGMPLAKASSTTGLFTLFGIPACIIGGLLPMRTGLRKPFMVIPGLLMGFTGLGMFLVNQPIIIYTSVALFGICVWIFRPALLTVCMELPGMTPRVASVVLAAAVTVANIAGFAGPLIIGLLTDISGSYLPGLIVCSVLSWSALLGGLLLPETGPRAKRLT